MAAPFMPFIQSITPRGLLSFGPDTPPLELRPLNVLIGPNGSGKSNLIDVIRLVRSMPTDMQEPIRQGGGVDGWIWKGGAAETAELTMDLSIGESDWSTQHRLVFTGTRFPPVLWPQSEVIEGLQEGQPHVVIYHSDLSTSRIQKVQKDGPLQDTPFSEEHRKDQSALAQFRSPDDYPVITVMAFMYERLRLYNAWQFGREAPFRRAQPTDLRGDRLEEDYSNFCIYLSQIATALDERDSIKEGLRDLYDRLAGYEIIINAGTAQLLLVEKIHGKRQVIPATRLSDGTLRYLCLLAILYNPNPPPLVCLEEPELGLHPDVVAGLAKHLRAASERMQLIVTTHSDILIDALSDTPESIVVFENSDGATRMKRLDADELSVWLEDYRLGELWTSGQIGGVR